MNRDLLKIINNFGISGQKRKFGEECDELKEAIILYESLPNGLYQQTKNDYKNHIAEEIADCLVLLKQFQLYYEIDTKDINRLIKEKVARTMLRIEESYYEKKK